MSKVTLDDDLRARLNGLKDTVELFTPDGGWSAG